MTGAVLDTVGAPPDAATLAAWRARVVQWRDALGWPEALIVARAHPGGATLAFAAPVDQLFSATEVNEYAWLASRADDPSVDARFFAPGHAPFWDEDSARHTLHAHARGERNAPLAALVAAAHAHDRLALVDDATFSLGAGTGVQAWPVTSLPAVDAVDWPVIHDIPLALVTGSNGKTTTVRLLAAMARAHGWNTAHSCTDGLYVGGRLLDGGDYSGPVGARTVLRDASVEAAILETARGGILRRGIAPPRADVAVVTNVSDDHFGEYGVYDLGDLADAKLAVARPLGTRGTLVLNVDAPLLVARAPAFACPLAWFGSDHDAPLLQAHRAAGGTTCAIRDDHLVLHHAGIDHDLGVVDTLPLSLGGRAQYNVANMAAAALAAVHLGIAPATIEGVLARFGLAPDDNPGRLQHWTFGDLHVIVDYAHNPDGLRGLLEVATDLRAPQGRLGLVLGQAGNRGDDDLRELAHVAAAAKPARIVLKEIPSMLRGRAPGVIPALLRTTLLDDGIAPDALDDAADEIPAARRLLAWAGEGDVVVLPTHGTQAKRALGALLATLASTGWRPGQELPAD